MIEEKGLNEESIDRPNEPSCLAVSTVLLDYEPLMDHKERK